MGVVIKQSIKATIHVYAGVIIGFITAVLVFPRVFTPEQVGLLSILTQISLIITQFGIMGLPGIITYYFFHFKDEEKAHHGLPIIMTWGTLIGCALSVLFLILAKPWIILKYANPLFGEHYYQLLTLTTFSIIFVILDSYYKGFYKVVLATFLKETFQRILLLSAVLLFIYKYCSFDHYVIIYSLASAIPVVILLFAIIRDGHFPWKADWKFITPDLRNGMITVGVFNVLASMSIYSNNVIDNIMVGSIGGLKAGGIYATTILFGSLVSIPSRTVKKITSALAAEFWKENDESKVLDIYKKSSVNLYIIGVLLFLGIWVNADNIMQVLPKEYSAGKWAMFWACLTNLMEMLTAAASSILGTSKYYKVQTYQGILLVGLMILTNYLLIPIFGLTGAAMAATISFFIFNTIRHLYIMYRWNMQPFDIEIVYVSIIGLITYLIIHFIPHFSFFMIDAVIRGAIVVLLFGCTIYFLKISPEINSTTNAILKKVPFINKLIKI